jgi:hypothetical protein
MDQTAAAKNEKTRTNKKDPAAFNMVAGDIETAGPECPDSNKQTYKSYENFLANMIIKQKFSRK